MERAIRTKPARRLAAIIGIGVVLVLANSRGWLAPFRSLGLLASKPFTGIFEGAGAGTGNFFRLVGTVGQLAADNQRLTAENADLRQKLSEDAELRQENEELRGQLSFAGDQAASLLPASVVSYQPDNFRQFLTINRGRRDGLREGMAVIAEGNQLVGKLTEVDDHEAKVFLLTDPTFKVIGLDQDTRADGTVQGQIGSGLAMNNIAQSDSVKPGDTVITSGLGGELPKGLIIGRIESVDSGDNAVFQSAQLVSGLKLTKLELVFVVTSS